MPLRQSSKVSDIFYLQVGELTLTRMVMYHPQIHGQDAVHLV